MLSSVTLNCQEAKIVNCKKKSKIAKLSKIVKNCQNFPKFSQIVQNCQKLSNLSNFKKSSTIIEVVKNVKIVKKLSNKKHWKIFVFFVFKSFLFKKLSGQVMSPYDSDQISQRSQVSRVTLCFWSRTHGWTLVGIVLSQKKSGQLKRDQLAKFNFGIVLCIKQAKRRQHEKFDC